MVPPAIAKANTPRAAPDHAMAADAQSGRIVIVGAGITGLVLSARLARRHVPHVVLERAARPGGVIRTTHHGADILEDGPQRTRLTPLVRALIREFDLEQELLIAPTNLPLYIYRAGALRAAPLSLAELWRTDLLSTRSKLRLLAEPFTAPVRDRETVAAYFVRRFGRAAYEDVLGPLFGGLYASEPSEMLARHALLSTLHELNAHRSAVLALLRRSFRPAARTPAGSFRAGMNALIDALFQRVREHVRLDTPAVRIETASEGYRVHAGDAALSARAVVLTCPAAEAAMLLGDIAPHAGTALAKLAYNRVALVHFRSDARLEMMGFQTSLADPLRIRGVTSNHALFGREGIYTAFLGGARDPDLVDRPDAEVGGIAAEDFRRALGHDAAVLRVSRTAIPSWDRTWTALEGMKLPRGIQLCANYESRIGIPGRIRRALQIADAL